MIQRKQTLFLLLVVLLNTLLFFFPMAELSPENSETVYNMMYRGMETQAGKLSFTSYPLAVLLTIISLIALITIFLYKKRMLQMRLTMLNVFLVIGAIGMVYFYGFYAFPELQSAGFEVNYAVAAFPVLEILLLIFAYRGIKHDENLVRSMDRIR